MTTIATRMSKTGRITVPLNVRAAVGLGRGGPVVLEIVEGELRLRSVAQAMDRARGLAREMLAGGKRVSVDDFIADRRREAKREA